MKLNIGRFAIRRDGVHYRHITREGKTIVIRDRKFPPHKPVYGHVIGITPKALAEGPRTMFNAMAMCMMNAVHTHEALIDRGGRGLNFSTLRLLYTAPTAGEPDTLVAWKASGA